MIRCSTIELPGHYFFGTTYYNLSYIMCPFVLIRRNELRENTCFFSKLLFLSSSYEVIQSMFYSEKSMYGYPKP